MLYKLTDNGKRITWKKWTQKHGCGISGYASHEVAKKMLDEGKKFDMTNLTLGDIAKMSPLAGREISRYAYQNLPSEHYAIQIVE